MARPKNSSRITPKGTRPEGTRVDNEQIVGGDLASPVWMGWLIAVSFILGIVIIVANYLSSLPKSPASGRILVGLGFVLGGILTATRWR